MHDLMCRWQHKSSGNAQALHCHTTACKDSFKIVIIETNGAFRLQLHLMASLPEELVSGYFFKCPFSSLWGAAFLQERDVFFVGANSCEYL